MKGLSLRSLTDELYKVSPKHDKKPIDAIGDVDEKLGPWKKYMIETGREDFSFAKHYHELPLKAFAGFSFDELCKLHYSSFIMMDTSVGHLFKRDARYDVVRKIESSMWRWSTSKGTWSEVVDAYENIRRFLFSDDRDFEVRLDHTISYNAFGNGKYSRFYIDGVFAYLVYYKRKHVMTIGFSILEGRRVLIQQVQSAKRTGNRYLYKLPKNRMEFVIGLFRANFLGYKLYLNDGNSLVDKTLAAYGRRLKDSQGWCDIYRSWSEKSIGEDQADNVRLLQITRGECKLLEEKIPHLEADRERLVSFYKDTGKFRLGTKTIQHFDMIHYEVV